MSEVIIFFTFYYKHFCCRKIISKIKFRSRRFNHYSFLKKIKSIIQESRYLARWQVVACLPGCKYIWGERMW